MPDTLTPQLRAGAALASALMAANYPGDSGEDVDRLIAELAKRGYRLQSDADDDAILTAVAEARRDETVPQHVGPHSTFSLTCPECDRLLFEEPHDA